MKKVESRKVTTSSENNSTIALKLKEKLKRFLRKKN